MERIEKQLETIEIRPPSDQDPEYYKIIAHMWSFGASKDEIATGLGKPVKEVEDILRLDRMKELTFQIKKKFAGRDYSRLFKLLVPDAVDTIQHIMTDKSSKDATRLNAALAIIDRDMGKPLQQIEHRGSQISELFEKLDRFEEKLVRGAIESESKAPHNKANGEKLKNETIDAEFRSEDPEDKIGNWVKENLK